ncbi:hypothetical protein Tco_1273531 [Tanacetum coccineum]
MTMNNQRTETKLQKATSLTAKTSSLTTKSNRILVQWKKRWKTNSGLENSSSNFENRGGHPGEKRLDVGYVLPPVVKRPEQRTEERSRRLVFGFFGELAPSSSLRKPMDFWCTMKVFKLDANASLVAGVCKGKLGYEHYGSEKASYLLLWNIFTVQLVMVDRLLILMFTEAGIFLASGSYAFSRHFGRMSMLRIVDKNADGRIIEDRVRQVTCLWFERYNFKAAISDGTAIGQFTSVTPNADILTGTNCPQLVKLYNTPDPREFPTELLELQGQSRIFQFHHNPYCEKGRVDFYFDTILDRPLEIASSSKTQTATTGSELISPALEITETVSEEIVNNLPTQIAKIPSQLITGNPEVDMMTSNPSFEPQGKTKPTPKEKGTPSLAISEYPKNQTSKEIETGTEPSKKTAKRVLF